MTVLKGEGKVPILFGSLSISAGTLIHSGYLARPDLTGAWPTILLAPSAWGVTSAIKDICRRLARHGFVVVAPDLYRGARPDRGATAPEAADAANGLNSAIVAAILDDFVEYVVNPAAIWSNAGDSLGVLGIGAGGVAAIDVARRTSNTAALALCYAPLRGPVISSAISSATSSAISSAEDPAAGTADVPAEVTAEVTADPESLLAGLTMPILGLYGRDDAVVPPEVVLATRGGVPHAEWALYDGVGEDFMDDYLPAYEPVAAADALDRLTGFFEKHLPQGPG